MADLTLIIGNKNYSSWSLRPWLFMKHYQLSFAEKRIALFTATSKAELADYNSNYKVPVLQDGDFLVWDSLAIMEYVSERYLDNIGWPLDIRARARARSVSAEMHSSFVPLRSELSMNCRKSYKGIQLSAAAEQDIERIQSLWQSCRAEFGAGGEWLFGEYSIADAMFAPVVVRFAGYNISLDGVVKDYVQTVLEQPCMMEWIAAGQAETEVIAENEIDAS